MAQPQDSGVGIFLAPNRSGQFIVTRVTPGGTAHRSGKVHIGDILLAVNGSGLEGIPVDTVRGMIVGPQGSQCNLTLQRGGAMHVAHLTREPAMNPRDASPSLGPGRRSFAPNQPQDSAPPRRALMAAPGQTMAYPQKVGYSSMPGGQAQYAAQYAQYRAAAQQYGSRNTQRSLSPMVRGPLYGSAGRPMGMEPGMHQQNYGNRQTIYGARQPPQQQAGQEIRHYTPDRRTRSRHPTPYATRPGYAPSPFPAPARGRQMVDQWGRLLQPQAQSPSPYLRRPATQAPASPAKGGLGMTLRNDIKGDLRITDIAPGGPAAACSKLMRGDVIVVIAGRNVRGMSVMQAKDIIMGPEGSTVVLGVHREARGPQEMGSGPGDFFEVTLVRAAHVAASRDVSRGRYSQSPAVQSRRGTPMQTPYQNRSPSRYGSQDYTPRAVPQSGRRPAQVNEAMCGIGVFIEASQNGLLTIKHVTPDGPASRMSEVQVGDFLVAIDGLTTLGMPMHQVRNMIVGRRGTSVCISLRRLIHDPRSGDTLSPVFDVSIAREPPRQAMNPQVPAGSPKAGMPASGYMPLRQSLPPGMDQHGPASGEAFSPPSAANGMAQAVAPQMLQAELQQQAGESDAPAKTPEDVQVELPAGFDGICGVGINVLEFDGAIIIQKVWPGGPAARSGLVTKGDLVHRLDYRTVSDMGVDEVRSLLQGPRLSSVVLGLIKPKYRLRVNVRLQREYVAEEMDKLRQSGGSMRKSIGPNNGGPSAIIAEATATGPIMKVHAPTPYDTSQNGLVTVNNNFLSLPGHGAAAGSEAKHYAGANGAGSAGAADVNGDRNSALKELTNISTGPDVVL